MLKNILLPLFSLSSSHNMRKCSYAKNFVGQKGRVLKNLLCIKKIKTEGGKKLPGISLAIANHSCQELRNTPRIRKNLGIKRTQEAQPNEWSEGRRPKYKSRAGIPKMIRPIKNSGDHRVCRIGLKQVHVGTTKNIL